MIARRAWEITRNDPAVGDGTLIPLGPLAEPPNPPGDPPLPMPPAWIPTAAGATALTFVSTAVDPFSQALGAYVGYDAASDNLFFVTA